MARILVAGTLAVSAAGAGAGPALSASPGAPAAGAPDPAQMVLQPADLAPGPAPISQDYQPADPGFVSQYRNQFPLATTQSGVSLLELSSQVSIAQDLPTAKRLFANVSLMLRSKSGREMFTRAVGRSLSVPGVQLRAKSFRLGPARALGVGDESLFVALRIRARNLRLTLDLSFIRVGPAIGFVTFAMAGSDARIPTAASLMRALAGHMQSGLAAR